MATKAWLGSNFVAQGVNQTEKCHHTSDELICGSAAGSTWRRRVVISSRCGLEMVLVAVSTPSTMALRLAEQSEMTLVGPVRQSPTITDADRALGAARTTSARCRFTSARFLGRRLRSFHR
jgi:hypothetical protein